MADHKPTWRVIQVLELVSRCRQGYTLSQISHELDIPASTLTPILHTLRDHKYLAFQPDTQRYHAGVGLFEAGSRYTSGSDAYENVVSLMREVVEACGETCHLGVLEGGSVLYLAKVDSPNPVRMVSTIGRRIPAYGTAIGKALLRDTDQAELEALYPQGLEPLTPHTITSVDRLLEECREVRRSGFAYEREESDRDVCCVAVPVETEGRAVAALSVTVPVFRWNEEKMRLIRRLLADAAKQASRYIIHLNI